MGIKISRKTDLKVTLKLLNKLLSFRFEQEYGEMEEWDNQTRDLLNKLIERISKLV